MTTAAFQDEHAIALLARLLDDRVLKDGDTFALLDQHGDINVAHDEQGLYCYDTRFLAHLSLLINGEKPVLLSSTTREDNSMLVVDLANPKHDGDSDGELRFGTFHLRREILVRHQSAYERLSIVNFADDPVDIRVQFKFAADFKDIFEVRGEQRKNRGLMLDAELNGSSVTLNYEGLDGTHRSTIIAWDTSPEFIDENRAEFAVHIEPKQQARLELTVVFEIDGQRPKVTSHAEADQESRRHVHDDSKQPLQISTSNASFDAWLSQSMRDVYLMETDVDGDLRYPYAGVPWYNTVFGRDGLIVALQTLWCDPGIARGVLRFLASRQASEVDKQRDAEPGKIVHEMRKGEMAATGEVPFREYYGTVDATPLFVMLAGRYYQSTNDIDTIRDIWPSVERAIRWMQDYGDHNGDGFVDYARQSSHGLANQGWKDSFDAIMHADGSPARGPIALAEVQGYVYAALCLGADLAVALGHEERAETLLSKAHRISDAFDRVFWNDDIGMYAMALDGGEHHCAVPASNIGHCLYTGIVPTYRVKAVADRLMADDMYSGWGIRTLSKSAARYNPMAYHNGSIWPHDNAIIAAGMARAGFTSYAQKILMGMFEASTWFERQRIPELFCGFDREEMVGPIGYPVACSPQAWASGAVFLMVQAILGLSINAPKRSLHLTRPALPEAIQAMTIRNLRVGDATVDLALHRRGDTVDMAIERLEGECRVIVSR